MVTVNGVNPFDDAVVIYNYNIHSTLNITPLMQQTIQKKLDGI